MKSAGKVMIVITCLLGLLGLLQGIYILLLFHAFPGSLSRSNIMPSPVAGPATPPLPLLTSGFTVPIGLELTRSKTSDPFTAGNRSIVPIEDTLDAIAYIDATIENFFKAEIAARVCDEIGKLKPLPEIPEVFDIEAPSPDLHKIKETARYWYLMSRRLFYNGEHETALALSVANLLLAHLLGTEYISGSSLNCHMEAIAVRNFGSTSIAEMTGKVRLPVDRLKFWINLMLQLEYEMVSISRTLRFEQHFIPSVFHHFNMRNDNILARAINNPGIYKKYIDALFNPITAASSKPYREAMTVATRTMSEIALMRKRIEPGFHFLAYYFTPESLFIQYMISISVPDLKGALERDFKCRQLLRGTIVALALRAFQTEHGKLPETVEELEKWLGKTLPTDIYSDKPLLYSRNNQKTLYSVGTDGQPDTADDLIFFPTAEVKSNVPGTGVP